VILPGHALRLQVSSSNFPRFARNPNTGERAMTATNYVPATQRVFHDGRYPSRVMLPVVES
jgi:predicted acyl esterase